MSQSQLKPERPQSLDAYQHLRTAAMSEWAWEYLRRNPDYQADARLHHRRGAVRCRLSGGALLTRMRARHSRAERWGLCSFR
jgi:hypothetical protein